MFFKQMYVIQWRAELALPAGRPDNQQETHAQERGSEEEHRARENVSDSVHSFSISIIKTWSLIPPATLIS